VAAVKYHDYDEVASHERSENPNSIDDSTVYVSPSPERSVPSPTVEEISAEATDQFANTFTPLGHYGIDAEIGARHAERTVVSEATTQGSRKDEYAHDNQTSLNTDESTLNRVPVGRVQLKNDGSTAEFTKWWHSSKEKNIPVCSQAICLKYDSSSGGEPPPSDSSSIPPSDSTSLTRAETLIGTSAKAAIEQDSRESPAQKNSEHKLRPASQVEKASSMFVQR